MTQFPTFPDLKGASVFITGGGSGIGAALTEGFVAQGARVGFVQRSDARAFCDRIEARQGTRPLFVQGDITDTAALRRATVPKRWTKPIGIRRWQSISGHISLPPRQ